MSAILNRPRIDLPPAQWLLPVLLLAVLLLFFGFFHWMLAAGLVFSVLWLRPRSEWPVWYLLFCLASMAQYFVVSWLSYGTLSGSYAHQGPWLLLIGNWLTPLLCMAVLSWMRRLDFRPETATSLRGIALLHLAAALFALLLMAKDFAYIGVDGLVGDVRQGRIVDMQPIRLPESLPLLLNYGLSHFMGGFLGVMLVVPMALLLLLPQNRAGSTRIIRSSLIYLYLYPGLGTYQQEASLALIRYWAHVAGVPDSTVAAMSRATGLPEFNRDITNDQP